MHFPAIPTDNLYKFLALSGLAILLFCSVYPLRLIGELQIGNSELETKILLLKHDADLHNQKVSVKGGLSQPEYDQALSRMDTFDAKKIQLRGEIRKSEILLKQLLFLSFFVSVGFAAGIILTFYGFRLWYLRVQKAADLIAAKEVK